MFVFASKGRREMPDGHVYLDGAIEQLSRNGTFLGQHVCTPLQGVAVHINAFNFPVWGMLEKLAPTMLAGVPAIVKPATSTCYVTEHCVRLMLESGLLPEGALQFVAGGLGDMLDRLTCQDVVSFTGSADTALKLRSAPHILENSVRFVAEQDSLNASILGPDAVPAQPRIRPFRQGGLPRDDGQGGAEMHRHPPHHRARGHVRRGDRGDLGAAGRPPSATRGWRHPHGRAGQPARSATCSKRPRCWAGGRARLRRPDDFEVSGADAEKGAFCRRCCFIADPTRRRVHDTEAFGPVSTVMGYRDLDHAVALANRGQGSLVASVITHDGDVARQAVLGAGAWHGRLYFNDRTRWPKAPATARPCRTWCMAGPAAPAAARNWAACAG